jgi:iron uptake system component EfeO
VTRALPAAAVLAAVCLAGLTGCSRDDGAAARSDSQTPASSRAGAGPGPGTGPVGGDQGPPAGNAVVEAGATAYRRYVEGEVSTLRAKTTKFTDAVRAGNVARAKELYAPSRESWARIGSIAGLVAGIDSAVDGQVDDFAGPTDPRFTGWHRLEYLLWVRNSTTGGRPFADQLDRDLVTLETTLAGAPITARAVTVGAGELIGEVGRRKLAGAEDRYSHTDIWDVAANIDGCRAALLVFEPALSRTDKALLGRLRGQFVAVDASLRPYQLTVGGWRPFTALTAADRARLRTQLATLAASLAALPAALGVA